MARKNYKRIPTTAEQEKELIVKYLDGDTSAFNALFHKYKPIFFYNAKIRFKDAQYEDVEDMALEFLGRISDKLHLYNPEISQVSTWMTNCMHNFMTEYANRKVNRNQSKQIGIEDLKIETNNGSSIEYQIEDESALSEIEGRTYRKLIRKMISDLSAQDAKIFQEHFINGKNQVDVADELGLPRNTIWYRVKRIKEQLEKYRPEGF